MVICKIFLNTFPINSYQSAHKLLICYAMHAGGYTSFNRALQVCYTIFLENADFKYTRMLDYDKLSCIKLR